jgi:hypothetical protein
MLALGLLVGMLSQESCIVRAGYGADGARIGITRKSGVESIPHGIALYYDAYRITPFYDEHGFLSELYVNGPPCQTDKGIKVGDRSAKVIEAYGAGMKGQKRIKKGDLVIGQFGDYVLSYPGIEFAIYKDIVRVIIVEADSADRHR